MAYDEATAQRVRKLLSRQRDVTEQKMMGSLAFLVNGAMCCSVREASLLVRVAADQRQSVLEEPHVAPMKMGKRTMKGFVVVAAAGIESDAALKRWIERGKAGAARKTR